MDSSQVLPFVFSCFQVTEYSGILPFNGSYVLDNSFHWGICYPPLAKLPRNTYVPLRQQSQCFSNHQLLWIGYHYTSSLFSAPQHQFRRSKFIHRLGGEAFSGILDTLVVVVVVLICITISGTIGVISGDRNRIAPCNRVRCVCMSALR